MQTISVGRCEGKTPLERPRRRWEDDIKMVFKAGREGVDWINVA